MPFRNSCLLIAAIVVWGIAICSLGNPLAGSSESRVIHFTYLTTVDNDSSAQIAEFFDAVYAKLCEFSPEFARRFPAHKVRPVSFSDPASETDERETVSMLSPLKFVEYAEVLGDNLVPMMVAAKGAHEENYYSPCLVVSNASSISDFNSPQITTVFMLGPHSFSGHIAPLAELYDEGVISSASIEAMERKGWHVVMCESHPALIEKVAGDPKSFGCTWSSPSARNVRTILRYGSVTQDIISYSADLKEFEPVFIRAFQSALIELGTSHGPSAGVGAMAHSVPFLELCGVAKFMPEHANSLAHIRALLGKVRTKQATGLGMLILALTVLAVCLAVRITRHFRKLNPNASRKGRAKAFLTVSGHATFDSLVASLLVVLPVLLIPALASGRKLLVSTPTDLVAVVSVCGVGVLLGLVVSRFRVAQHLINRGKQIFSLVLGNIWGAKLPEPPPTNRGSEPTPGT